MITEHHTSSSFVTAQLSSPSHPIQITLPNLPFLHIKARSGLYLTRTREVSMPYGRPCSIEQLQRRRFLHHGSFFTTFVVVFTLWSRGLVTSARAWTTPQLFRGLRTARSSSVAKRNISLGQKPTTGWNHNLPEKDSSFWKKEEDTESTASASAQTQQGKDDEPRTGWLHNTKKAASANESNQKAGGISKAQRRLKQAMKQQQRNHRIASPPTFHACESGRRLVVTEHYISLPLDRSKSTTGKKSEVAAAAASAERIDVYFTITEKVGTTTKDELWWNSLIDMTPSQRANAYILKANLKNADGLMLYLQGGPGFGAPTPMVDCGLTKGSSWAGAALDDYPRIVLMDQRGTGRSTPVTKQSLERKFPDLFSMDGTGNDDDTTEISKDMLSDNVKDALEKATNYMASLRADNIVQDAEEIRDALLVPSEAVQDDEPRPWGAALGQSFGGFCMMTYLSQVAHPPKICLLTGGIAPMLTPVYDVYDMLWDRVKERSLRYYEMYPGDVQVVKKIVGRLLDEPAVLPSGGKLTARRFLQLGLGLGGNPSAFASLHTMFSTAFVVDDGRGRPEFTRAFLKRIDSAQPFDDFPIYFLLHESIYADGSNNNPTNWAAHRAYEDRVKTPSEFDYKLTSQLNSNDRPTLFFGEMVFPWMADGDFAEVSGTGMKMLATALSEKDDWGPLYDGEHMKKVLKDGSISKAAAAVYLEDMYVEFNACMEVTKRGGPLEKCKIWVTNDYQHSGLRDAGASIYEKLMGMANGSIRTPS